jgi:hypothetical protein
MKNLPNVIFLQVGNEIEHDEDWNKTTDFRDLPEVTWCEDSIHAKDVKYIREDFVLEQIREAEREILEQLK